jgi:hypothetical protein
MENPIYKFMKENGLTQKDETTFLSEYSDPNKAAQLHKFMVDNKLTTKGADDFYNEYFSASKKKVSTDSSEPAAQPTKPSAPSFGQKVVSEVTQPQIEIPLRGKQKPPVAKKPYQDIYYKPEGLPSETTQAPETPVIKAAKQDFKQTQLKPQIQPVKTAQELEEIEQKTEKADKTGLVLNEYQSSADALNELNRLKKDNVNEFYRNIKDARPDLYEKYSGRTIQEGRNIESDISESQKDRDIVYQNYLSDLQRTDESHRNTLSKVDPIVNSVVDKKVTPENYKRLTTSHSTDIGGDVVDMGKVDDEATAIAEKYNLPTDGEAWRLLKNKIKSNTDFQIVRPQAEELFKQNYPELHAKRQKMFEDGFKYDDEIYSKVESELTSLQNQYEADAKNELNAIDAEYKSKSELLNQQYKDFTSQSEKVGAELDNLYKSGQIDRLEYENRWGLLQKEKKDYYDLYEKQFPSLDEYVKKSNEINSKYNRKFELQKKALTDKAQAQIKAEFDKYSASYKEDPAILEEINKAYRDSYELASDIRTKTMGLGAEMSSVPMSKLYQSTLSSLGGVFKGWGGSLDSKTLELLGESMEQNFMMPAARTEEFKDWLDPQNLQLLTGQLLGSMAPSMAITAAVATSTGGTGIPAIVPMITGGLAGWASETVDIVGRSYLDMFEKSGGDVAKSNKAAESSLKSQYDLMWTYSFDALPFVGGALKRIPSKLGRVAVGAGIETGTEFLQEYPQNIAEENIQKGLDPWTNLGEALQDTKKMKQTLISIGPVAILGGAGQLGSKSARQEAVDTYVAMQQKTALSAALPDQKRQYIQNMVFDRGGKFARGVIGSMFTDGTIDEETSKDLLVQVENSERIQEAGKSAGLKGSKLNVYGFYSARAEEAEANAAKFHKDPILSESYKQQAKQYRDAGLDFMKGNNPDLLTVTYADGSQAIMTPEDVNGLFSNPIALTLLNKKKISVEAYREGGQGGKALQELIERADAYKQSKKYVAPKKTEDEVSPSLESSEEIMAHLDQVLKERRQKRDARDIEIEQIQKQREALGVNEVDAFFSDMKPLVATMVERMEAGQAAPQSGVKAASDYLYAKYKELTAMKSDPNRMMTIAQIESIQAQIEQDLQTLAGNPPSQQIQTNDQENIQGVPSEVGVGQEPVTTQPIEVTSEEAPATGGVLQAQEEVVTPQVTEEPAPKAPRKTRLAKLFEVSEGEEAVPAIEQALSETGIKVEVKDDAEYNEDNRIKDSQGRGSEGMFVADDGTIILNRDKIKGEWGKTIVFHEGIHPVVNIIRNTDPKRYKAIVEGLKAEAARNNDVARVAADIAASEEYQRRGPESIEDETVVETMARVATGDVNIDKFNPTFREKFIEFMNDIAKALGLKPILTNSPRMEVQRLASQINKMLNEGGKISDIVGKKNVGKFQNTISDGQYSIDARIADKGVQVPRSEKLPLKIVASKEEDVMRRINELLDKYPNALTDKEQWKELMSRVFPITVDGEVFIPAFPEGLARMAGSVQETLKEINKVSDEQRKLASEGLKGTKEIGELYKQGKMDEVDTGLYFLWNIMSIGISPYPQESGFLQAVNGGVDKYIKLAAAGEFNENTLKEYLNWVDGVLPKGTPGAGSKSNLNSFGKSFLSKAAQKIESGEFEGKTKLQALHEILSDRKTPTNELRRKWQANMSAMQFNNKIFDFILLTTGRSDLFVTDRVRVDHFWDGNNFKKKRGLKESTSLYDGSDLTYGAAAGAGFSKILSDVPGLVFNELANRTMTPIVEKAYKQIGVKDYPEVGRFHWETWVAASSQEVSHGSIDAIVQRKEKGEIQDAGIRQGKYGAWDFNFAYKKRAGKDFVYEFVDNDGNTYVFDKINDIQDEIEKQKKKTYETNNRFLLPDAKGNISRPTKGLSNAWYDTELVDAEKYFEFLRSKAKEIIPAPDVVEDQGVVIERPKSEKISKEKKPTGQPSQGILRGKRPTKAEVDKYLSEQEFFRSTSPFAWAVDPVSEETLKKSRIVENEGTYGVVTEDGDIKGVFNPNAAKQREGVPAKKNTLAGLIPKAINAGGIKLDNFDGRLTELYSKNGFRKVSSVPFNEEYAPEGWSKEKDGTPDVVAMVYDPDNKLDVEFKKFDDYGDMISYRDSFVDQARKEVDKKWGEKKVIALTKRDELGTKADREIAAYASKFLNKFGPYTKANVIQIMNMSAEEKIKLINDTFEAKFKNRKPEPGDPEDYFYEQGVKRRDQVLALVGKPTGQPSMVKRTPAQIRQAVEDGVDAVEVAIAEGMDPQQAVDENISSQDWYGDLTPAQKEQLNEILQDEFGATASEPKLKNNAQRVADLWEKGGKEAKAEIKNILETDPELSYIYNNFPKITKQLEEQGLLTKTENCP